MHFPFNNKRRHLDCDKVNPGAHDKGSWWILTLLSLLVIRSCALLAGVASVSNRVIAPKLERQQNKIKEGGGRGDKKFPFLPISSLFIPDLSFALIPTFSTNSRGNAWNAGKLWLFVFLSFFLLFFFKTILWRGVGCYNQTCIWRPLFANSWLTA